MNYSFIELTIKKVKKMKMEDLEKLLKILIDNTNLGEFEQYNKGKRFAYKLILKRIQQK